MHVHPSTLTGVVKRLARRGLVRRRSDPRDGRRMLLSLTAAGRAFDVKAAGTIEAAVQSALDQTPGATITAARKMLGALTAELERVE
jgi:DNA-binding MarR family transcriptional regulator